MPLRVLVVVGARPNFVKAAPLVRALVQRGVEVRLLHTGQHYDRALSEAFFEQLGLPHPDVHLGVGSGTHAEQTAGVIIGVEAELMRTPVDALVVAGDVNSTMAAALAAAKLRVPVVHLESGLRSRDWTMPEEINRVVTDRVSDLLLCHSEDGVRNLRAEGVEDERIRLVGNTMIDSLFEMRPAAAARSTVERLGLKPRSYVLVTLHRPALVDAEERLGAVLDVLGRLASRVPVVLPLHPRTRARLEAAECETDGLITLEPLEYLDFLCLQMHARLVITDSGGVQEEASALGVPCLTYRTTTERPVTITHGTNRLVGVDADALLAAAEEALEAPPPNLVPIPLWDGRAGQRAAAAVVEFLESRVG